MITQRDRYTHRVPRKKSPSKIGFKNDDGVHRHIIELPRFMCHTQSMSMHTVYCITCFNIFFDGFSSIDRKKNSWHDWSFRSWQLILNQRFLAFFLHCMVFLLLCSSNFLFLLIFGWKNCVFSFLWGFDWKSEKSTFWSVQDENPLLEEFSEELWNDVQSRPKSNKHIIFSNWNQSWTTPTRWIFR